jgi:outer membrane lipoprotein-sorting protein
MKKRHAGSITRIPRGFGRAWWWRVACPLVVATLAGAGCDGQAEPSTMEVSGDVVRVRYLAVVKVEDGQEEERQEYEVIADRDRRARITYLHGGCDAPAGGCWTVWDGQVLVVYDPAHEQPLTRIEGADVGQPPIFVFPAGSEHFAAACVDARRLGTHTLLGRTAVRYACAASDKEGAATEAHEMSLDQATRLLLQDTGSTLTVVATEIDLSPDVDADAFATDLPGGVEEDPAQPAIEDVRLPRVGGGEIAVANYPRPLLIVVGDAAGIRNLAKRLLPLTGGGGQPQVMGILIAVPPPDWQGSLLDPTDAASFVAEVSKTAGAFPVPVAIDIKGAASYLITQAAGFEAGQTTPTVVGLVGSDGTLTNVATDAASDAELRDLIETG